MRTFGYFLTIAALLGCPPKETPPTGESTGGAETPDGAEPDEHTLPSDHTTSSVAVELEDIFRVPEGPDVVATVNSRPIYKKDLEQVLRQTQIQLMAAGPSVPLTRFKILDGAVEQLVELQLRHDLADQLGAKPDPAFEEAWLADLEERMKNDKSFGAFLLRAGKNADERRKDAREKAIAKAIIDKIREDVHGEIEAEAKGYYERNKSTFLEREGREAWRLFVKAPKGMIQRDRDIARTRIEDLHQKAKANPTPENFENLVKSFSEGGKANEGGFIGWVAKNTFAQDLEQQLYAAKPNTVLPIYEDAHGYYIYFVGRHRPERQKPFEEVKDQIYETIYHRMIDKEIDQRMEALRAKQKVEIHIPELNALRKAAEEQNRRP